ncbi:alpha/beta fold hydrolase [Stenotrophobium rhamnosiphilum]|uniref:AB hydrolase-1 domain-containing protein n=1 Tax=Stenotrophobium rhamnosiphilum TaxID=2029166 RepID=A0A2T5MGZ9_9GAMM|nr:alpha/beta hydrolase [Stenotrophobium rhamnosiphilum]PTU31854.1 hypothetical protein CJD38_03990 [Stenotrophobium rhamnosiphilum]
MNRKLSQAAEWYEGGEGSTLVLVHGFSASWRFWKPLLPLLEKHHRVIALTLPGHVGGVSLKKRASPLSIAEALAEQLRERGITQAHFVGQSLGGWMVFEMARLGLARSSMGICSAGAFKTRDDVVKFMRDGQAALKFLPYAVPILKFMSRFSFLRRIALAREMKHGDRMSATDALKHFDNLSRLAIAKEFLDEKLLPIQPLPADNKVPLRVLWGADDTILPFERFGQPLLDTLKLPSCVMVDHWPHTPMFDDPQRVAKEILEFTREVESKEISVAS